MATVHFITPKPDICVNLVMLSPDVWEQLRQEDFTVQRNPKQPGGAMPGEPGAVEESGWRIQQEHHSKCCGPLYHCGIGPTLSAELGDAVATKYAKGGGDVWRIFLNNGWGDDDEELQRNSSHIHVCGWRMIKKVFMKTNEFADMQTELERYFDRLWPICRSLTGNGVRDSLRILSEIVPMQLHEIPSGTQVLDWTIPNEWNIQEAYIITPDGKRIADIQTNNLHIVSYSIPVEGEFTWEELAPQ